MDRGKHGKCFQLYWKYELFSGAVETNADHHEHIQQLFQVLKTFTRLFNILKRTKCFRFLVGVGINATQRLEQFSFVSIVVEM